MINKNLKIWRQRVDLVIGIPSYNSAETLGYVVKTAMLGALKYYPGLRCLIVCVDGGSKDASKQVFLKTKITNDDLKTIIINQDYERITSGFKLKRLPPKFSNIEKTFISNNKITGKGAAFKEIFKIAEKYNARACVVVDSDLKSITPKWIELLSSPILYSDYDFLAPYYARHKYDGTITNSIIYPLTTALYGKTIRQPIGGEFGISNRLFKRYNELLADKNIPIEFLQFGIDIFLSTTALAENYKTGQAFLGAKVHNPKNPKNLGPMFYEVVKTVFELSNKYKIIWQNSKKITKVPIVGFLEIAGIEEILVNEKELVKEFKKGFFENQKIYKTILSNSVFKKCEKQAKRVGDISISRGFWAKIVWEYLQYFNKNEINKKMVESLIPLYFGFTANYIKKTENLGNVGVERYLEKLVAEFLKEKRKIKQIL